MKVTTVEQELRAAGNLADYEAVDVLWVCLLKLANRMPGTSEHCRMLALVDGLEQTDIRSVLRLKAVDQLLDLRPPLETVLADPHERLEPEDAAASLDRVRKDRDNDQHGALVALGSILKRIRNKRAHGFKTASASRDGEILGAARSILEALCLVAIKVAGRRDA